MRQSRSEMTANPIPPRRGLRHVYTLAAGLLAVAIAAAVVVEERSAPAANDGGSASVAPRAASLKGTAGADASTWSSGDAVAPHFQRSEEPANDDDPAHPYGG